MKEINIRKLVFGGLMIALVFIATGVIPHIPIPFTQGYIHVGDSMIFIAAILFGWKYGAIVGGVGSALADLFLGYTLWIIPTLVIKSLMGALVGLMCHNTPNGNLKAVKTTVVLFMGGAWVLFGIFGMRRVGGIMDSPEMAASLMDLFTLSGKSELIALISNVQAVVIGAIIIIPLFLFALMLFLKKKGKAPFGVQQMLGMTLGGLCMIMGYFIAEAIIVGNIIVPIFSIPFNLLQFTAGIAIALLILTALKRAKVVK